MSIAMESMSIPAAGATLAATVTRDAVAPARGAALVIAGAGPRTRKDTSGLVDILVRTGLTTLAYDKRGTGESTGDFESAGLWDLVEDNRAALSYLAERVPSAQDRLVVLGISQGAGMAVMVHAAHPVAGLVLVVPALFTDLGSPADRERSLELEYHGTRRELGQDLSFEEFKRWREEAVETIRTSKGDTVSLFGRTVAAKFLRESLAYDAAEDLGRVQCPVLVIGGAKDLMCPPPARVALTRAMPGPLTYHVVPDMTHALSRTDETPTVEGYADILQAQWNHGVIDDAVKSHIRGWVAQHFEVPRPPLS